MEIENIITCLKEIQQYFTWNVAADEAMRFAIKCVEKYGEEMEAELNE